MTPKETTGAPALSPPFQRVLCLPPRHFRSGELRPVARKSTLRRPPPPTGETGGTSEAACRVSSMTKPNRPTAYSSLGTRKRRSCARSPRLPPIVAITSVIPG